MLDRAMILAAGYGTRLKPLTDSIPKALVKVNGKPMLQSVLEKMVEYGIKEVVINTHHHAALIEKFVEDNDFGIKINLSYEKEILGTGGGIKNARPYLIKCEDFLVHNVDVISDININEFYEVHKSNSSLVTLAVKKRETTRALLVDERSKVVGNKTTEGNITFAEPIGSITEMGFCCIHIISSKIFSWITEEGFFDIFTSYFRMIKEGKVIKAYDIGGRLWIDLAKMVHT